MSFVREGADSGARVVVGDGDLASAAAVSTRTDIERRDRVDAIIKEVLGNSKKTFWYDKAMLAPLEQKEGRRYPDGKPGLASNPPIKFPVIPINYGNSCVGILDTEAAKTATARLFEAYGIELKKDVPIKGEGYEFVPDGYNEKYRIGFKLMLPVGRDWDGPQVFKDEPPERKLDDQEMDSLDRDVKKGKLNVFVVKAGIYPNMDGDLYTPMEFYLASVVDYLNWVHGDKEIDRTKVLGRERKGYVPREEKKVKKAREDE